MFHAVAPALKNEQIPMMYNSVNHRCSHLADFMRMIRKIDSLAQKLEKIVDNAIDEFICKDRVLLQRNLSERVCILST